jgi:hypothetical protein
MAVKRKKEDYEIGYGKPPKHSQFKKGKSGNESGRTPKANPQVADVLLDAIGRKIFVIENGSRRSMTKFDAAFTQTINKAAAGDLKSMQLITQLLKILGLLHPAQSKKPLVITARIPFPSHLKTAEDVRQFEAQDWRQPRKYYDDGDPE